MKLTKYEHACVVLEDQGQKLVIDPGMFSPDFNDLRDITALVITHQHGDHFDLRNIENIVAANPGV